MLCRITALLALAGSCLLGISAQQAGYLQFHGQQLSDRNGNLVSGTLCATTNTGVHPSGGGQQVGASVCTAVTNGVFSMNLPDGKNSYPTNPTYSVTVLDSNTGQNVMPSGYDQVQVSTDLTDPNFSFWCNTTGCNFDLYQPNQPNVASIQRGPAGPAGGPGPGLNWRGTYSASTSYAPGDAVYYIGAGYVALVANSSASPQTPGQSPPVWGSLVQPNTLNVKAYGAKGDGITDDTVTLNNAMTAARTANAGVVIPSGTYLISNSIDARGLHVTGAGMYQTTLKMSPGVQKSVVLISTNTWVDAFGVYGGWDRTTSNGTGYGIEATTSEPGSTSQLPYHMTITNMSCQNTFGSSIYLIDAAYALVQNNDCHNSGGRAILDIDSHDNPNVDGFGPTTITAIGNTFSDTMGSTAPAIRDNDCVNCRIIGNTMENTGGIVVVGPQNRSLVIDDNYQENTSTNKFASFSGGSGIGVSMHGNRGGPMLGPLAAELVNWSEIDIKGNWFAGPSFGDSGFASTVRASSAFFDPNASAPAEYVFNPGTQTAVSQQIFSSGASWAAVIRGTYTDFTGGVSALSPIEIVTSASPSINVGHTTITFSMSSSGALQGIVSGNCCGATTVRLLGWIDVYSDRNHGSTPYGLVSAAPIQVGGMNSSGAVTVSGSVTLSGSVTASGAVISSGAVSGTSLSTGGAAAVTGTCTTTGYKPLVIDGVTYKLATCQ